MMSEIKNCIDYFYCKKVATRFSNTGPSAYCDDCYKFYINKMHFKKCTNPDCYSLGEREVLHHRVRGELFECQICFEILDPMEELIIKKRIQVSME